MWLYFTVCIYFASGSLADFSSNYYCADMNPQPNVIISKLMGMWFAVEIFDHASDKRYRTHSTSCPVIHISEDQPHTTISPLYNNYNFGYNYGEGHGTRIPQHKTPGEIRREYKERSEYDRQTTYRNYPLSRRVPYDWIKQTEETKYLRLHWDENDSDNTEYHLRYNIERPGFWISSGPETGMSLDSKFSHFAGTVQVLKAVGSHLVLTICHQVPERQLYTVLLSREVKLDPVEKHGVHSMLHRKGLNTDAVKKVCNNSGNKSSDSCLSLALILTVICRLFWLNIH